MPGALDGIRVLDLSRYLAGPGAAQMLGDFGAEVIKVERPGVGDDQRRNGASFLPGPDGRPSIESAYYLTANRNKRGIAVDIAKPEGQEIVRGLAAKADVLIENFKVGGLAAYRLDYDSIREINPRIVYCSVTGFGQSGPYSGRTAYDPIFQALSGLASVTGYPDGHPAAGPLKVGTNITDVQGSLYAVIAILAALRERDQVSGLGQYLDVALLDCTIASMSGVAQPYFIDGRVQKRAGNDTPSGGPNGIFECADGSFMISIGNDGQFAKLCAALGRAALGTDLRFSTNAGRIANKAAMLGELAPLFRSRTLAGLVDPLAAAGIAIARINDIAQVFEDPQVRHRDLVAGMPHPLKGDLRTLRNPLRFSRTPVSLRRPPPMVGEHTDDVLRRELGYGEARIAALRARDVL